MKGKRLLIASLIYFAILLSVLPACALFQQAGWDAQAVPSKVTQLLFEPRSAAPSAITGTVYYDSDDDNLFVYAGSWTDLTGAGAPIDADYLVGSANDTLTNEIVVGATPGGELGGTWASPTIDDLFLKNNADDTTTGTITINKADGGVIFDNATSGGTDFWMGVNDDGDASDDDLFQVGDGTTFGTNPFVTVNTSGQVGIGTSPAYGLDVVVGAGLNDGVNITGSNYPAINARSTTSSGGSMNLFSVVSGQTKQWSMYMYGADWRFYDTTDRVTFQAGGNVGVNDVTPDAKLEVVGDLMISSAAAKDGDRFIVNTSGNVGIGTISPNVRTAISGTLSIGPNPAAPTANNNYVLVMGDNTAEPTMGTDTAGLYGMNVGTTVELFAVDEAGNEAQLTPHNFDLFNPSQDEPYPWSYYACNRFIGKCINVDIAGAIREIERLSGKKFIYYEDMPEDEILSWDEQQQVMADIENTRRLAEAAAVLVEVPQAQAVESYMRTETRPVSPTEYITTTTIVYELDSETGQAVAREVVTTEEVTETVEIGLAWRLKAGCQLEAETGKFFCPTGEENAVYEPYVMEPMPAWMQDRALTAFLAPQDISSLPKPDTTYKKIFTFGNYALWVAEAEPEQLMSLHQALWSMEPQQTLGCVAMVKRFGQSFYSWRVRKTMNWTVEQSNARRTRIADWLSSMGYNVTFLRGAPIEDKLVEGIVKSLGLTTEQFWNALR